MGRTILLLWDDVRSVQGLWIILVDLIPQEDCLRIIYDFTWRGMNAAVICKPPSETMQFGRTFLRLM